MPFESELLQNDLGSYLGAFSIFWVCELEGNAD